jgi:oxygen-dependent protoporphyrinogen oxidase
MQRLVNAIVRQLPRETLHGGRPVDAIRAGDTCWQLISAGTTEEFDQIVLAVPAHTAAKLMSELRGSEHVTELLREISYSSAVTVALGYKAGEVTLPPGFGFLVPRSEAKRMIACTFVHNKFEGRAPADIALLRVFLGGTRDPEVLDLSESEILKTVQQELREILHVTAEPRFARVFKWYKAMAQYEVGHLLRVARLEMHMQRFAGLHLAGNGYHGIGIPDCVRLGRSAADLIMRRMRAQQAPA